MARTKQTARTSTGAPAPRKLIAAMLDPSPPDTAAKKRRLAAGVTREKRRKPVAPTSTHIHQMGPVLPTDLSRDSVGLFPLQPSPLHDASTDVCITYFICSSLL
jgi:hypothetical protein